MAMAATIPASGYPNRAARKAAKRHERRGQARATAPALRVLPTSEQELATQRARQDHYRRLWWRQLDGLLSPDDDAYSVMRTARLASDHGTARATVVSAVSPALLRYLERSHATPPPAPPLCRRIADALGRYDPHQLAAARVALARELPEHSLVLELTGWQLVSEHDLARAFDEGGRSGWSRPSVHNRKWAAVTWIREWLAGARG